MTKYIKKSPQVCWSSIRVVCTKLYIYQQATQLSSAMCPCLSSHLASPFVVQNAPSFVFPSIDGKRERANSQKKQENGHKQEKQKKRLDDEEKRKKKDSSFVTFAIFELTWISKYLINWKRL